MSQSIVLPDEVATLLGTDPSRRVLEAVLVQLYRQGHIGSEAVGRFLGLPRDRAVRWLGEQGAPYFDQSAAELDEDLRSASSLRGKA